MRARSGSAPTGLRFLGGQGYAFDDTTIRMMLDEVRAISLDTIQPWDFTPAEQVLLRRLGLWI